MSADAIFVVVLGVVKLALVAAAAARAIARRRRRGGVMTMVVRRQWPQSVAISRPRMVVVVAQY